MKTELLEEAKAVREWGLEKDPYNKNLACMCAICSFELFKRFRAKKLHPTFHIVRKEGYGSHCFVICNDFMLDVTATQFQVKEPVNVIELDKVDTTKWFWNYNKSKKLDTTKKVKRELIDWPSEQRPEIF